MLEVFGTLIGGAKGAFITAGMATLKDLGMTQSQIMSLKKRLDDGEKLSAAEYEKLAAFGRAMLDKSKTFATQFGDEGAAIAKQIEGHYNDLVSKMAKAS
jgi:hypothetical protein